MVVALVIGYFNLAVGLALASAFIIPILTSMGVFGEVEDKAIENRRMEHAKEQLRAYSELEQVLSDMLEAWGRRYNVGRVSGMRTFITPFATISRIENLLQKDAWLFDETTKNTWREAKLTVFYGLNEGQEIVVDVTEKLQTHVKEQLDILKRMLNLE
jgi:hypothetical protein